MAETATTCQYRGERRDGAGCVGTFKRGESVIEFVEAKYRQRWAWLTVEENGIEVGGITVNDDTGQRIWWADGDANDV